MPTIALVDDDQNTVTPESTALAKDLKKRGFRFVGPTTAYAMMQACGLVNDHLADCHVREKVEAARQNKRVTQVGLHRRSSAYCREAADFIRKPFSRRVLIERIKVLLRRGRCGTGPSSADATGPEPLDHGDLYIDIGRRICRWKGAPVTLTVTEFLILQALVSRPGVVKNRDALMDVAYGDDSYVDDRTIDSHIKRLRRKLRAVDNSCDVIETLYGVGYRFKEA